MWTGSKFFNDKNKRVMDIQFEYYRNIIFELVKLSIDYQKTKNLAQDNNITKIITKIDSYDHRVIQGTHDLLAAVYRFEEKKSNLDKIEDITIKENWELWMKKWLSLNLDVVKQIIISISFENSELGYKAERKAESLIIQKNMHIPWNDNLLKVYGGWKYKTLNYLAIFTYSFLEVAFTLFSLAAFLALIVYFFYDSFNFIIDNLFIIPICFIVGIIFSFYDTSGNFFKKFFKGIIVFLILLSAILFLSFLMNFIYVSDDPCFANIIAIRFFYKLIS